MVSLADVEPQPRLDADCEALLDIYRELDAMHAWRGWHWWPDADPFEVCVGAILVQNTSWTNVERALDTLGSHDALSVTAMDALPLDQLETLVRSSGQFRQKARKLRAFLDLIAAHGSLETLLALPPSKLRAELLDTWGIGPETADCILLYAARKPAFVIDAYTMRLFNRLGFGPASSLSYDHWQSYFMDHLPQDRELWARYHALIVLHGKHLCRKRRPACHDCTLQNRCPAAAA